MALPGNITTITLTGDYRDFQGVAIVGQVKIYPSQILIDALANRIIIPNTITADLVNGVFSLTVPVTNDVDVVGNDGTAYYYYFEESFTGGSSYIIYLPSSLGASVDISDLRATDSVTSYLQPVSAQLWPPVEAALVVQENLYNSTGTAIAPFQYQYLPLFSFTYAALAADFATYAPLASTGELNFTSAKIQAVLDRMTRRYDHTATSADLYNTTNGGTVTSNTYHGHSAKWGTYQTWSNQYALYSQLTGSSVSWTYAQIGTLMTQLGYALTGSVYDVATITDNWLKITRSFPTNTYGGMTSVGYTYTTLASAFATYGAITGTTFPLVLRDTADRLKDSVNRPNPLMTRGYQYGINL